MIFSLILEKNGLLFMETSALESVNVEAAFNTVLSGILCVLLCILNTSDLIYMYFTCVPCPLDFSSSVRLEIGLV